MEDKMNFLVLLLILISCTSFAEAQHKDEGILLVAHKNTPLADYKTICEKKNYLCFPQAFSSLIKKQTPHFDFLIENFDLDDKDYVTQFSKKLSLSLKEDDLTLEQIKNLILATEKIAQNNGPKLSGELKNLKKIYEVLSRLADETSDKMIFVAGKNVANNLHNRLLLDPYLNDLKHSELDYTSITQNGEKKYFLNGDCDHPRYTEFVSQLDLQVIPHFSEGCNLSQKYDWGTDLMADHFKANKNKYLIGLATVATIFFLQSYELSSGNE